MAREDVDPGDRREREILEAIPLARFGTPEDFNRFNRELRTWGLTQLLDIAPGWHVTAPGAASQESSRPVSPARLRAIASW